MTNQTKLPLRWHKTYIVLLNIFGILGCFGLCLFFVTFHQLSYVYSLGDAKDTLIALYILLLVIDTARVIMYFIVAKKLKDFDSSAITLNHWLQSLCVFASFLNGGINGFSIDNGFGWLLGFLTALFSGLAIYLPIFIYYDKRKHLFMDNVYIQTCNNYINEPERLNDCIDHWLSNNAITQEQASILQKKFLKDNFSISNHLPKIQYCRKCGEKLFEGADTCHKCGTTITLEDLNDDAKTICTICNGTLPENSEFCQYCGTKIEGEQDSNSSNATESSDFETANNTNTETVEHTPDKKNSCFCKICGNPIDTKTKKCMRCGKKHSRFFNAFSITTITLSIIIIGLTTLTITQHITITNQRDTIDLKTKKVIELWEKNFELYSEIDTLLDSFSFYEDNVVIVEMDGSKKYHTYDCRYYDSDYSFVYDIAIAKLNGYSPCSKCLE